MVLDGKMDPRDIAPHLTTDDDTRRVRGPIMDKQTVVVLFGGRSSEHSISSATGGGVLGAD